MNNASLESFTFIYLGLINLISGFIFLYDKRAAIKGRNRIPEKLLHILEISGGIFIIIPCMYIFHHKNRKFSYYCWSWVIFLLWIILLFYLFKLLN